MAGVPLTFIDQLRTAISLSRGDLKYTPAGAAYVAAAPDTSGGLFTDAASTAAAILSTPVARVAALVAPVAGSIGTWATGAGEALTTEEAVATLEPDFSTAPHFDEAPMWPDEITVDPSTGDVFTSSGAGGPDVIYDPTTTGGEPPVDWMRGAGAVSRILGGNGSFVRTGIVGAATGGLISGAGAGLRTLASILGRGAASAGAYFTINGVRGTVAQLWKYTRALGPEAVAAGLGITVGALGELLLRHPDHRRHRRRGISHRDIRTTKRVVNFVSRMAHQIGCVSAPRHFRRQHAYRAKR